MNAPDARRIILDRPAVVVVAPRLLSENDAAAYVAVRAHYLRNIRTQDVRRQARGEPIQGPQWITLRAGRGEGKRNAVRYERAELDAWIDRMRGADE